MKSAIRDSDLYDPETGIPGPELFRDRLRRSLARADRSQSVVALISFDLGEKRLDREAANAINRCLRGTDTVALTGDNSIAVIQTDLLHFDHAAFLTQKLLDLLNGHSGVHAGIAIYPENATEPQSLISAAEGAMLRASQKGTPYGFCAAVMTATARAQVDLGQDLRTAILRDEMVMYYQPKVDLYRATICGVEALLRWQHAGRGMVLPEEFLHIAEETDLIVPLGDWALRQACGETAKWRLAGASKLRVAVNVAAQQLARPNFADTVGSILEEAGLPPHRLELELSERTIMTDPLAVVGVLENLHQMGVEITVDDFGTGYSFLSHLKLFPISRFKIDRTFITGLPVDPDDVAIVRGVIGLGHGLKLEVVAEGVDTQAQLDFLRAEGCDQVQGYYYSPPLPATDTYRLLQQGLESG